MNNILAQENRDSLLVLWAILEFITALCYVVLKDVSGFKCLACGVSIAVITFVLYLAMGRYR